MNCPRSHWPHPSVFLVSHGNWLNSDMNQNPSCDTKNHKIIKKEVISSIQSHIGYIQFQIPAVDANVGFK